MLSIQDLTQIHFTRLNTKYPPHLDLWGILRCIRPAVLMPLTPPPPRGQREARGVPFAFSTVTLEINHKKKKKKKVMKN